MGEYPPLSTYKNENSIFVFVNNKKDLANKSYWTTSKDFLTIGASHRSSATISR